MNETVVKLTKDKLYDKYVEEIGPECLIFVSEAGKESVTTLESKFFFIPGNGAKGQVLKKSDSGFFWDDFNSVRNHTGIGNVPIDYNTVVIRTGTNNSAQEESEIVFLGTFVKGQQVTLYITKSPEYDYGYRIILDREKYVNLNNIYSVDVTEGVWSKLIFFYDGTDMYVDVQSEAVITRGDETLSMVSNSTNVVKNQYELSLGKYNKSTKQTGNAFGVKNSIFTVGNGFDDEKRHDAFMVCQDGSVYVPLTRVDTEQEIEFDETKEYYEKPIVCLQNWIDGKIDKPKTDGTEGQVLTKTEDGIEWEPVKLIQRTIFGQPFDGSSNVTGDTTVSSMIFQKNRKFVVPETGWYTIYIRNNAFTTFDRSIIFIGRQYHTKNYSESYILGISMAHLKTSFTQLAGYAGVHIIKKIRRLIGPSNKEDSYIQIYAENTNGEDNFVVNVIGDGTPVNFERNDDIPEGYSVEEFELNPNGIATSGGIMIPDDSEENGMISIKDWVDNRIGKITVEGAWPSLTDGGKTGQILTKTEDGVDWKDPTTPLIGNYIQSITQNGGYITYKSTNFRTQNSDERTINFKTINSQSIFGQGDIKVEGGSSLPSGGQTGQVLTKTNNGAEWKSLPTTDGITLKRITREDYNVMFETNTLDDNTLYLITG